MFVKLENVFFTLAVSNTGSTGLVRNQDGFNMEFSSPGMFAYIYRRIDAENIVEKIKSIRVNPEAFECQSELDTHLFRYRNEIQIWPVNIFDESLIRDGSDNDAYQLNMRSKMYKCLCLELDLVRIMNPLKTTLFRDMDQMDERALRQTLYPLHTKMVEVSEAYFELMQSYNVDVIGLDSSVKTTIKPDSQ